MFFTVASSDLERLAPDRLADELEKSRIVYFPACPVGLPEEGDLAFLRDSLAAHLLRKNISYYPAAQRLAGLRADPAIVARTLEILQSYSARVQSFLRRAMPSFMRGARLGTSSFRPLQEHGRALKPHASNELVHVDAGAYGATHGDRILRFFTNVNSTEDRLWITKGSFAELYQRHARSAGIAAAKGRRIEENWLDRAYSGLIQAAARVFPMARVIDSSPYDRAMRRFHNYLKDSSIFQRDPTGRLQLVFPPHSSWMVLTDAVSHACTSGRHALVDTFLVPLENCRLRQRSPYDILKGSSAPPATES